MRMRKAKRNKKRERIADLPEIPNKKYFTIGEAGRLCGLMPYVLRFWEQEFSMLKPVKRRNRRYYQQKDILMIRHIANLLYEQGFTIEGARVQLSASTRKSAKSSGDKVLLEETLTDLKEMLGELEEDTIDS
jgi:DNA-binding transcriptional MerR regulator